MYSHHNYIRVCILDKIGMGGSKGLPVLKLIIVIVEW